jgi:hypothetical protein
MTTDPFTQPMQSDDPKLIGVIQSTSAWESIPKFIRFTVWVYAILTVIGLAVWPLIFLLAILGL